ncbi:MAG: hypothetical protein ACYC3X_14840 [Pirellulaceae bacterium]
MLCRRYLVQASWSALVTFAIVLPGTNDLNGQPPTIHRGERVVARRETAAEQGPGELKENVMEMLIGDPFVDLQ